MVDQHGPRPGPGRATSGPCVPFQAHVAQVGGAGIAAEQTSWLVADVVATGRVIAGRRLFVHVVVSRVSAVVDLYPSWRVQLQVSFW